MREKEREKEKKESENRKYGNREDTLEGVTMFGKCEEEEEKKKKKKEKVCVTNTCENGEEKNQTGRKKREKMKESERREGQSRGKGSFLSSVLKLIILMVIPIPLHSPPPHLSLFLYFFPSLSSLFHPLVNEITLS